MADVGFWNDPELARRKLDAYQRASGTVEMLNSLRLALDALHEGSLSESANVDWLARHYRLLVNELPRIEFTSWLSGPHDQCGAYIAIGVTAKTPAARQWAAQLARMYTGWARTRSLTSSLLGEDVSPEGRAFTLYMVVSGFGAYGLLQHETGSHKLLHSVKTAGRESLQRLTANVNVLPELDDNELPTPPANLQVSVKEIARGGILIPRLTSQVSLRHPASDRRLSLASNLPPDDLTTEAKRLLITSLHVESDSAILRPTPPVGGIVRTYARSGRDKGVHDHRTGLRTIRVKQVLDGDIQQFLDESLKQKNL